MQHPQSLDNYLSSLAPVEEQLTDEILNSNCQWQTIIHRRATNRHSLIVARSSPQEFSKIRVPNTQWWQVHMNEKGMGMSCSNACIYPPDVRAGAIPRSILLNMLPNIVISDVNAEEVEINGEIFKVLKCFNRTISVPDGQPALTIGDAHGKSDQCLMGPGELFSFYWDSMTHGTMCMRNTIEQPTDEFQFRNGNQEIVFAAAHALKWTECDTTFIKIPNVFIRFLTANKDTCMREDFETTVSNIKNKNQKEAFKALWKLFGNDVLETTQAILVNDLLSIMYEARDLQCVSESLRGATVNLIDEFADIVYGWDTSHWNEVLRPGLLEHSARRQAPTVDEISAALEQWQF